MQKCTIFRSYRNINLKIEASHYKFNGFIGNFEWMPDISTEIKFKTARSGGKGGQNVNKVESMVTGYWNVDASPLFNLEQKELIRKKLKITLAGDLLVKSQTDRSQLANKLIVTKRMNSLISKALVQPKKRKSTKPSKGSIEQRLTSKKKAGDIKLGRKKINTDA